MTLKKIIPGNTSIPVGLGMGLLVSILVTIAGAAVCAWLISAQKIGEGAVTIAATVILIFASASGAFTAAQIVKKMRLQMCLLCAGCYYLTLLATTALFFGGQYQNIGLGIIAILVGAAPIAFLPGKNSRPGKWRKRAYR